MQLKIYQGHLCVLQFHVINLAGNYLFQVIKKDTWSTY